MNTENTEERRATEKDFRYGKLRNESKTVKSETWSGFGFCFCFFHRYSLRFSLWRSVFSVSSVFVFFRVLLTLCHLTQGLPCTLSS
jgi:hypothetical protein